MKNKIINDETNTQKMNSDKTYKTVGIKQNCINAINCVLRDHLKEGTSLVTSLAHLRLVTGGSSSYLENDCSCKSCKHTHTCTHY